MIKTLKNLGQVSGSGDGSGGLYVDTIERTWPSSFNMEIKVNPGERYGMLTIIKEVDRISQPGGINIRAFLCECDCGNKKVVRLLHLRHNRIKSCGCLVGERHGMCNTQLYTVWRGMKNRCYGEKYKEKKYYQDKGISVCDEWKDSFLSFREWALNNGYKEGLTIDRKESNKDYTPDNCRWVTPYDNMINSGASSKVVYHGKEIYLADLWKGDYNRTHMAAIRSRIKRGWSVDCAFDTPIRKGNYKRNELHGS
jgi:hypothetical protein